MKDMIGIVNLKAGKGQGAAVAEKTKARFRTSGINLELLETQYQGHATILAKTYIEKGHRDFLCMGGDGTIYETINGLSYHGPTKDLKLGIVPIGTGNSFLKDFNSHSMNLADKILQNKTRACDVIDSVHSAG